MTFNAKYFLDSHLNNCKHYSATNLLTDSIRKKSTDGVKHLTEYNKTYEPIYVLLYSKHSEHTIKLDTRIEFEGDVVFWIVPEAVKIELQVAFGMNNILQNNNELDLIPGGRIFWDEEVGEYMIYPERDNTKLASVKKPLNCNVTSSYSDRTTQSITRHLNMVKLSKLNLATAYGIDYITIAGERVCDNNSLLHPDIVWATQSAYMSLCLRIEAVLETRLVERYGMTPTLKAIKRIALSSNTNLSYRGREPEEIDKHIDTRMHYLLRD